METTAISVPTLSAGTLADLRRTLTRTDAARERIADGIRLLWRGLERLENDVRESEPDLDYPELDLALAELSPRRIGLIRELSRMEMEVRRGTISSMLDVRREFERAKRLVADFEAAVSDMFLMVFWLDLGVGD